MHYQKHSQSTAPATSDGILKRVGRFDTLDWIAAVFVITTPIFIAYRLFWN